jgi:conjugal transfer pilus assembly protein TrbC
MEAKILLYWLRFLLGLMLFQGVVEAQGSTPEKAPQLLVFVSFSMPEQSLKLWSEQTAKFNGQLLLRGFVEDSLEKTTTKTLALFGKEGNTELLVNPEAFSQFNIQAVPAVVVTEPADCLKEACPALLFDVVYGNTDLEQALRWIAAKGSEQGKQWASMFLKRYRATNGQ